MIESHELDNQSIVINNIISAISRGNPKRFFLIKGPSGSGKTYMAHQIAEHFKNLYDLTKAVYLNGDIGHSERPYFPFINSVTAIDKSISKRELISKGSSELSKGIPFAGDFVSYLIDVFSNSKSDKKKETVKYLNEVEQLLLFDLEKSLLNKKSIIIADNIHWWDESSLDLLFLIVDGKLNEGFPIFAQLVFLFVFTDDQPIVSQESVNNILRDKRFEQYIVQPVQEINYLRTLQFFGFNGELQNDIIHMLFSITGGHLLLIEKLAYYLSENNNKKQIEKNNNLGSNQFIEDLFSFRLKALGAKQTQIINILEYASIIGLSFGYDELMCISKEDDLILMEIIQKAKEYSLIDDDSGKKSFSHDIIRAFFLSRLKERKLSYSKIFSECLSVLRPSDYFTRAKFLFESGNSYDSIILYMIGHFQNLREGNETSKIIKNRLKIISSELNLSEVFALFTQAYNEFFKGNYYEAISLLNNIEDIYPRKLLAEKYYLLSLCLSRSMENHFFQESISCLEGWDELKLEESEIWLRIMSTKLVMHSHLYDFETAKSIEKRIMFHLIDRLKFDQSANTNINIIRRKSGALHVAEIAKGRTQKSFEYFSKINSDGNLLNPIQFFMATVNHSGNLLILGEYIESFKYSKISLDTLNVYHNIPFPKSFIAGNNYILSGLLSQFFPPIDALKMFEGLSENFGNQGDYLLIKNNIAITHCLNGDIQIANKILTEIYETIKTFNGLDNYYQYFTISNLACVRFLIGDRDMTQSLWTYLNDKIPNVPEINYLNRRHELLKESFDSMDISDPILWYNHLKERNPYELGKSWTFFGQGFLFSDLQFWSES